MLVTGAGQGIGLAITKEALGQGAIVAAVDVDAMHEAALRDVIAGRGSVYTADVRDADRMTEIVSQICETHGGIDIVIANAGIERVAPIADMDPEFFRTVLDVNIHGVYNTIQPALNSVIERGGHVLAISSIAGLIPFPLATAYSTSKAAVDMMMRVVRMELTGTGATAGAGYFGFVQTQMADRIFSNPATAKAVDRLPSRLLGVKPLPTAEAVARLILKGISKRRSRIYAPRMVAVTYVMRGSYAFLDGLLGKYTMRIEEIIREFRENSSSHKK
ncbi:SDR family NAD(P)-dependent oxidoreductase [Sagittula sp. NFXS13]|uniref:SDR family NAD(P)-dependent oxidoreductase n=1 Tax=Sagittula sp. NFXS13 TaxID=2819095 RepID=UPI0032E0355B